MFLGRESEVTGKITSLKLNASKNVLLKMGRVISTSRRLATAFVQ